MSTHSSKKQSEIGFRGCTHTRLFQFPFPEVGEELWCPQCEAVRTVVTSTVPSYRLECNKCELGGVARRERMVLLDKAKDKARSHVKSKRSHKVVIKNGSEFVYYVEAWDEGEMTSGQSLRTVASDIQSIGQLDN